MGLFTPLENAWRLRGLIRAILSRELAARFRGSIFSWAWAIIAPLVMMSAYTVIFSGLTSAVQNGKSGGIQGRSLVIFSGITLFNLYTELLYRAPALLHEHAGFIKKSIFPSETFAWIAVLRAFVYAGVGFGVQIVFQLVITHHLPLTILLTPLLILPMLLLMVGATWVLMALGAFTRDVVHLMAVIVPLLMWVTPVFYKLSDLPAAIRPWMHLNIMADYIDMFRDLTLYGTIPNMILYLITFSVSYVLFMCGYIFFMKNKSIIIDVI